MSSLITPWLEHPPRLHRAITVVLLTAGAASYAGEIPRQCFDEASARFGNVGAELLQVLAQQESSGRCTKRHPVNANGSYDIGCMGINSSWLPTLRGQFGLLEHDLYDPCTNVHVGAWIYAKGVRQHGNTWRAIGAYNAVSEDKRIEYAWKIYKQLNARR